LRSPLLAVRRAPSSDVFDVKIRAPSGKRIIDLMITIPALVLSLPIMMIAALLIRMSSPGPVLFRQVRIGEGERPFTMLKLRTMHVGCDDSLVHEGNVKEILGEAEQPEDGVFKPKEDPRIIPTGRLIRRFSIDELPQLVNVLRGDMSVVGPRPSLPWEVELYTVEQRRRHQCRPGMTGLWQVSGRNRLSMLQMLELDLVYLQCQSVLLDLWIIWRTIPAVLFADDTR
jgi:lipopolysaccharide/colanic/teichoic acid biosynthesis glycosyltransferase